MPGSFSTAPEQGGAPFENESCGNEGKGDFLDGLRGVGQFLSALQTRLRFGKASRLPLNLLRLELKGDALECDWIATLRTHGTRIFPATFRSTTFRSKLSMMLLRFVNSYS